MRILIKVSTTRNGPIAEKTHPPLLSQTLLPNETTDCTDDTDGPSAVFATPLPLEGAPAGVTRVAQFAEGKKHYKPLATEIDKIGAAFGKPPRLIAATASRSMTPPRRRYAEKWRQDPGEFMPQVFQLISGPLMQKLLSRPDNLLGHLLESEKDDTQLVTQLFQTILTRDPTPTESTRATTLLSSGSEKDRRGAADDLAWALLNSKEFIFRQ